MTYEEAVSKYPSDPYQERYIWCMVPDPGYGGHEMLEVIVLRTSDMFAWSAVLGRNVNVDKALERMKGSFSTGLWLEPADYSKQWEAGTEQQLKDALTEALLWL